MIPKPIRDIWLGLRGKPYPHPEPFVRQCIDQIIKRDKTLHAVAPPKERWKYGPDVFVHVGGNSGVYVIPYARKFVQVFAIEPDPKMAQILQRNLDRNWIHNVLIEQIPEGLDKFYGVGRAYRRLTLLLIESDEFNVLAQGYRTLAKAENIIVELHSQQRKQELETRLRQSGFQTFWIDSIHVWGIKE